MLTTWYKALLYDGDDKEFNQTSWTINKKNLLELVEYHLSNKKDGYAIIKERFTVDKKIDN